MYRCHHGRYIKDGWQECPECCAEEDNYKGSVAAQETAAEIKKQNKFLQEQAEYRRKEYKAREEREQELEEERDELERELEALRDERLEEQQLLGSQKFAVYAEERYRMNDLPGAIQLITQSIHLNPSFLSFYYQRAKYFIIMGLLSEALDDIKHCLTTDPKQYVYYENKLRQNDFGEFQKLSFELTSLINSIKDNATSVALDSIKICEAQLKLLDAHYQQKPYPDPCKTIDDDFIKVNNIFKEDSYQSLLTIPKLAQAIQDKIQSAIKIKITLGETLNRKIDPLLSRIIFKGNYNQQTDFALDRAQELLSNARKQINENTFESFNVASALLTDAEQQILIAEKIKKEIDDAKVKRELEEKEKNRLEEEERKRIQRQIEQNEYEEKKKKEREENEKIRIQEQKKSQRVERSKSALVYGSIGAFWGLVITFAGDCACQCSHYDIMKGTDGNAVAYLSPLWGALIGSLLGAIIGYTSYSE